MQKVGAVIVADEHSLAEAVAAINYKECGKRILVREVHTYRNFNICFWANSRQCCRFLQNNKSVTRGGVLCPLSVKLKN